MLIDELSSLARTDFGMFQRTFPFKYCPAVVIVGGELGEDRLEIRPKFVLEQ